MNQTVATAIGLVALVVVLAIPVTILWLVGRSKRRTLAAIAGWAVQRGLQPSQASASASVHPSVPALSFARDRDLVSLTSQTGGAQRGTFTIYLRPEHSRLPALGLQRKRFGGGGEAIGDPALDAHYRLLHGGAVASALLSTPPVHEALLRDHASITTIHVHEGVLIVTYEVREAIDPEVWERAWTLADRLVAAVLG